MVMIKTPDDIEIFLNFTTLEPESYYRLLHITSKHFNELPGSTLCKYLHTTQNHYSNALRVTRALLPRPTRNTLDLTTTDLDTIHMEFV